MAVSFVVLCVVFIVVALFAAKLGKAPPSKGELAGSYRAAPLLTDNEREFFARLVQALPGHYIFPQVGMGALIASSSTNKKIAHADRLRVAQQRVDFVVCNPACRVLLVIELDDRTHNAARDERRDERLRQAGIRSVRFQSNKKPNAEAIREAVFGPATQAATAPQATAPAL